MPTRLAGALHAPYKLLLLILIAFLWGHSLVQAAEGDIPLSTSTQEQTLEWTSLPDLPEPLGLAGPFVGIHNNALLVAGGANFPQPIWDTEKLWHDEIYVLKSLNTQPEWIAAGKLPRLLAYGAAVSLPEGILCLGGCDVDQHYRDTFLLRWNSQTEQLEQIPAPPLPIPLAYAQATRLGNRVYIACGQQSPDLTSATASLWSLEITGDWLQHGRWQQETDCPGPPRAFSVLTSQHNGYAHCLYLMSGRSRQGEQVEFLRDVWEYEPLTRHWRARAEVPRPIMAGTAVPIGQSHFYVLSGDDGANFFRVDELKDQHPGFPQSALSYNAITNAWAELGHIPTNQVTTIPVQQNGKTYLASGEVRPRVRTPAVWEIRIVDPIPVFGWQNYTVLFGYLTGMVGIGLYFATRNKNTDDYFRGGKQIPWWAAGCSIFATMLSSLTFTGIPAKAFAQDWVYAVGNFMIPVIAFAGIYVALPFYRRIDATSAYEYLELRFSRSLRLFGSASFTLFHLFRMAVVMSLTALAIAIATPLTPAQAVLLMGILSIIYCTLGGIEAVIWTDTIQTVVLLGGAILALVLLITGLEGGLSDFLAVAQSADKFRMINLQGNWTSPELVLWVVIVGAIGQNLSSYTADQAVVQRYMTTSSTKLAARSIWTNAVLSVPATLIFFAIGTALFAYYQAHPEKLSATVATDQIFPLFIANEIPVGMAGLIVAAVFSAAQSTVSTSMNSTATCVVTDFLRPLQSCKTETGFLRVAQFLTLVFGMAGTLLALIFIDPAIRSLFDAFMKVIGLFMGVLGGLFLLGVLTTRANAPGAILGAFFGTCVMIYLWLFTHVNGYLYTSCGIATCFLTGYLASFFWSTPSQSLENLTLFTLETNVPSEQPSSASK